MDLVVYYEQRHLHEEVEMLTLQKQAIGICISDTKQQFITSGVNGT